MYWFPSDHCVISKKKRLCTNLLLIYSEIQWYSWRTMITCFDLSFLHFYLYFHHGLCFHFILLCFNISVNMWCCKMNKFFKNVRLYNLKVLMFLISLALIYLNLKKLMVVECTVAAVHVWASKQIKDKHVNKVKAICLLRYSMSSHSGQTGFFLNLFIYFLLALQCLLY